MFKKYNLEQSYQAYERLCASFTEDDLENFFSWKNYSEE